MFERDGQPDTPLMRLERMLRHGTLYDVDILTDAMQANLGDLTFQVKRTLEDPCLMSMYGYSYPVGIL